VVNIEILMAIRLFANLKVPPTKDDDRLPLGIDDLRLERERADEIIQELSHLIPKCLSTTFFRRD